MVSRQVQYGKPEALFVDSKKSLCESALFSDRVTNNISPNSPTPLKSVPGSVPKSVPSLVES